MKNIWNLNILDEEKLIEKGITEMNGYNNRREIQHDCEIKRIWKRTMEDYITTSVLY